MFLQKVEAALADGKVNTFLTVLTSKLTQYDQKLHTKQPNQYRIGHYLAAAHRVEAHVHQYKTRDDEEALGHLKKALAKEFILRKDGKFDLPPVNAVVKQIDQWLAQKKLPSLVK